MVEHTQFSAPAGNGVCVATQKLFEKKGVPEKSRDFLGKRRKWWNIRSFPRQRETEYVQARKSYFKKRGSPKNREIFWGRGGSGGTYAVFGASRKRSMCSHFRRARVVELVDTRDLKSLAISVAHGFESRPAHQVGYWILETGF